MAKRRKKRGPKTRKRYRDTYLKTLLARFGSLRRKGELPQQGRMLRELMKRGMIPVFRERGLGLQEIRGRRSPIRI